MDRSAAEPVPPAPLQDGASETTERIEVLHQQEPPLVGVVGIGASAGGFESVRAVFENLPAETGLAIVLVQHLDPTQESMLPELISNSTRRPVHQAEQGMKLEPDHVYVIPPNALMFMSGGQLTLEPRVGRGRTMPIDLFFRSLALEMHDRGIAVVLSGNGSDGSLGVESVKADGGFTFAEAEESARFPSMPNTAVGTGCVDMVLPAAEIGREIGKLSLRMRKGDPDDPVGESELYKIFDMLRAAKGVDFTNYRHTTIRRRILRRMLLQQINSLGEYVVLLKERPAELAALYHDVLIRVTSFFRDAEVFAALKETVFPEILGAKRPQNAPVRVWVPGCATGEEAYSIAMSLVEYMVENRLNFPIQVFATDISDVALETARAGTYVENIALDVSPERLRRFFTKVGKGYQISQSIRDVCVFARQNMTSDPPFSKLDMVSCRNVLIYLSPILQKKVLPIFHYALKPGGFLLLGSSETTGSAPELFEVVDKKNKIFIKTIATARPTLDFPFPPHNVETARVAKEVQRTEENEMVLVPREADKIALARYAPPGVIVNQDMQIVEFRGQTGFYLEPAPGVPSHNLLRMAREGLALELRAVVHKVQKSGEPIRTGPLEVRANGSTRHVIVDVMPLRMGMRDEPCRFYLVSFEEVAAPDSSTTTKGKKGKAPSATSSAAEAKLVAKLKQELAATREYLQSIIEEMEATNEELQSANEEILSSNEELQSINEELETAKEELQSTNEEITTVNEELRARNVELAQVNNDLNNALSSMNIPIVMLGADLRIRRFTPMAERVLHLIPSDVGRPLSDIRSKLDEPDIASMVAEAIDGMKTVMRTVRDREGRSYSMRIRPYRTADNKIDGAVMAMLEVDEQGRSTTEDGWHDYMDAAHEPILVLDEALRVLRANQAFVNSFGISHETAEGQIVYELGKDGEWNIPDLRTLLEETLPRTSVLHDYRLEQDFPGLGRKAFSLNVRRVRGADGAAGRVVLAFAERTG
ncbi:CheR family methyltransferase [Polyangium aurulentum]|uniref:CheR family methyltransferase n=1 Tax=Polyangium aurulentum TaxID=2567896 RepID=UPI00146F2347|nr:CheR family methyltransferase [Polyangium aurulentum]UQA62743.1 PAS domain-containing protein [Polyangium aurulentum]